MDAHKTVPGNTRQTTRINQRKQKQQRSLMTFSPSFLTILTTLTLFVSPSISQLSCSTNPNDYDILSSANSTSELLCGMSETKYRAISSYYLSVSFIKQSQYFNGYHYAVRFLEIEPLDCRGHLLLSYIYSSLQKEFHASFYLEIALLFNHLCTIDISLLDTFSVPQHPIVLAQFPKNVFENDENNNDPLSQAIRNSIDGKRTLSEIFIYLQNNYRHLLGDSSVYSLELFLQQLELLISCYDDMTCTSSNENIVIPTINTRIDLDQLWPMNNTAYVFNWPAIQNVFGENVVGLSDAISRLGIPTAATPFQKIHPNDIIIKPVTGTPQFGINNVIWNFEKNPNIAAEGDKFIIGFITNACGREEATYEYEYFAQSASYWESIPTSIMKWRSIKSRTQSLLKQVGEENVPPIVPAFLPLTRIQFSILMTNFYGSMTESLREEKYQPIDILFLGNANSHRQIIRSMFNELSKKENIRVEFYFQYDIFDFRRDNLIDQAKIVLNLGNFDWPPPELSTPLSQSFCNNEDEVLSYSSPGNWHRIKGLLSRGKVVLSERTGSRFDEEELGPYVLFSDTALLTTAAMMLLNDANLREFMERNAVKYIYQDHFTGFIDGENGNKKLSSLANLSIALTDLGYRLWPDSLAENPVHTRRSHNPCHGSDLLSWAECRCARVVLPITTTSTHLSRPLSSTAIHRFQNSSSTCSQHLTVHILLEYLMRRHDFQNSILHVGCSCPSSLVDESMSGQIICLEYCHLGHIDMMEGDEDEETKFPFELLDSLNELSNQNLLFDVVLIEDIYHWDTLYLIIDTVIGKIQQNGYLLMTNMRPMYPSESEYPPPRRSLSASGSASGSSEKRNVISSFWCGDVWQAIPWFRSLHNFDTVLGDFARGVLIAKQRQNAKHISNLSPLSFVELTDQLFEYIPLMDLHGIHQWI